MGRHQIVEKLDKFLIRQPFKEECEVLYLMAEIRKVLDHAYDKKKDFPLLRFYCDWMLHTEKTRQLENIALIVEKIFINVKEQIEKHPIAPTKLEVVDFLYMEELKKELVIFLTAEGLSMDLCLKNNFWIEFIKLMTAILSDQPIINPTPDVTQLIFLPAAPGCVRGEIHFAKPIVNPNNSYNYYTFANAY